MYPIAEAMVRSHQIYAGRRLVALLLGLSFLILGSAALIQQDNQVLDDQTVESQEMP
jgi:hypothetical protein